MTTSDKFNNTFVAYGRFPEHTKDALFNYLVHGYPPGGFLTAVMCNNLFAACASADSVNGVALQTISKYITCTLPMSAYGSKENIMAWCDLDIWVRRDILVKANLVESVFDLLSEPA